MRCGLVSAGAQARDVRPGRAGHPARPRHALHPGADAAGPARAAGPPQEPRGSRQDTEAPGIGAHRHTLGLRATYIIPPDATRRFVTISKVI